MLTAQDARELLNREPDFIDDVRYAYEVPNSELGDDMADAYLRVLDLSTQPGELSRREVWWLNGSIQLLNDNYETTVGLLDRGEDPTLLDVYHETATQVNRVIAQAPYARQVGSLAVPSFAA